MKIAIWHNLGSGGAKRALYHHVQGLVDRGHHVEVWCPPDLDQTYLPLSDFVPVHTVPLVDPDQDTNSPKAHIYGDYLYFLTRFRVMEQHCRTCVNEIERKRFELLMANTCSWFHMSHIGRYTSLPAILYLQEPYRPIYEAWPNFYWMAPPAYTGRSYSPRRLWRALLDWQKLLPYRFLAREERISAGSYDKILVNSSFSRESLLRAYGLESEVCYLGVDTDLFRPNSAQRQPFVLGVSSFHWPKGIDRAIRAISTIPIQKRPELIWIGNANIVGTLDQLKKLAAQVNVEFKPKLLVSDEELVQYLNQAAVFIYTPRLEPFGFAPLEAGACETPVVAIAEGGVRETISDGRNGLLVLNDDPLALGRTIMRLLEDKTLRRGMGIRAREIVMENWSWKAAIDRLECSLSNTLQDRKLCNETNRLGCN